MRSSAYYAGVMELADVLDSKSSPGNRVRVRPPPPAPRKKPNLSTRQIRLFSNDVCPVGQMMSLR